MAQDPWVSIIINNYNYGSFLRAAIESALAQTYKPTEVIVVDDGSTDNSRQVIGEYGNRIVSVLKDNAGQASAVNAGFTRSHGDLVFFLDADDLLLPEAAEQMAQIFQRNPNIARIQYRLAVIDGSGARTGAVVPPTYLPMPSGDLRRHAAQLNNYAAWWPPTSGNAFSSLTLRQILPMPEGAFRLCADYYLLRANALCGPIVSVDEVHGYYRFHGSNHFHDVTINLEQTRRRVALTRDAHVYVRRFAESRGVDGYTREVAESGDLVFLAQRMVSLKLDAAQHPIPGDRLLALFWRGAIVALNRSSASLSMRALYVFWFAAMLAVPRSLASLLAEKFFHPQSREKLNQFLGALQHGRRRDLTRNTLRWSGR
jgi:hypothetical protein